jgi:hypothetical protein
MHLSAEELQLLSDCTNIHPYKDNVRIDVVLEVLNAEGIYMYIYIYVCIHICILIYMYEYICICVYIYINIYVVLEVLNAEGTYMCMMMEKHSSF